MADINWFDEVTKGGQATKSAAPEIDWFADATKGPNTVGPVMPKINQDTSKAAGIGSMAVAGLADDPQAQINYLARQRGISPDRYGIKDGQIYYIGDDGKAYAENPKNWGFEDVARRAAAGLGGAIPAVTGAVGGIVGMPLGPLGSVATATAGGAVGQGMREGLAAGIMGQDVSPVRIVKEGLVNGIGQSVGLGLTKLAERGLASDISRMDPVETQRIGNLAQGLGIELTPAERTALPSLKAQQKWLGNTIGGAETLAEFYQRRAGQVKNAIDGFLGKISPVDSGEVAGTMASKAANASIEAAKAERAKLARPLYEEAFGANLSVDSPLLKQIENSPAGQQAFKNAVTTMRNRLDRVGVTDAELTQLAREAGLDGGAPVPRQGVASGLKLEFWDQVKQELDGMATQAARQGDNTAAKAYGDLARKLRGELDALDITAKAGPNSTYAAGGKYAQARAAYAGKSVGVQRLEDGIVGLVSDIPNINAGQVVDKLLGPKAGPMSISEAKNAIQKADPAAWDAVKRNWLGGFFESAKKEFASTYQSDQPKNVAGQFAASIENNLPKARAALEPAEFQALRDLTDVLKRAGSVKPVGSDTEFNRLMTEAMKDEARPVWQKVINAVDPTKALRALDEWATTRGMEKYSQNLAETITSPDAMNQLRQLKMLSPRSISYRVILGNILANASEAGANASMLSPADVSPKIGQTQGR